MSTRWSIGEQVQNRLSGGKAKAATWADIRELYKSIEQVLNGLMKIDYFKTTLDLGETALAGMCVATYNNIPVVTYRNSAKLKLPAMPLRLPLDMGLAYVGPSVIAPPNTELTAQFIPLYSGGAMMANGQPLLSDFLGQIAYERNGLDVIFTTDITKPPNNITSCTVKLAVMDMSQYGDYDLLPIPADMEAQCVEQVYQMFAPQPAPAKVDDPITIKQPQR